MGRCVARSVPNTQCATEFVAFRKMYSTVLSFGTWSNPSDSSVMDWAKPWAWYPQEVKDAAAKYGCCLLTKGGVGADLFENSYLGQVQMDTRLNCVVDPPCGNTSPWTMTTTTSGAPRPSTSLSATSLSGESQGRVQHRSQTRWSRDRPQRLVSSRVGGSGLLGLWGLCWFWSCNGILVM